MAIHFLQALLCCDCERSSSKSLHIETFPLYNMHVPGCDMMIILSILRIGVLLYTTHGSWWTGVWRSCFVDQVLCSTMLGQVFWAILVLITPLSFVSNCSCCGTCRHLYCWPIKLITYPMCAVLWHVHEVRCVCVAFHVLLLCIVYNTTTYVSP